MDVTVVSAYHSAAGGGAGVGGSQDKFHLAHEF
jgi:hypothetical protein